MCGITGYFVRDGIGGEDAIIKKMIATLHHRGPDDSGSAIFDTRSAGKHDKKHTLGIANARLAILDLSPLGHQPMYSTDKSLCLVYNGEIFNFIELREELQGLGHSFISHSDTEVILAAYEQWGEECVKHFNGMWAFALYDSKQNTLFCSRDRFGIKPFYYYDDAKQFVFGSEIKSISAFGIPALEPNQQTIASNIVQGFRFVDGTRHTFYKQIEQLLAAENLVIDLNSGAQKKYIYWSIDPKAPLLTGTDEQIIAGFRDLLIDSVRIRLRSDVPYTFALSGGMDSSSIVSIAKKVLGKEVITFSAVYDRGNRYDEQEFIEPTVEDLGITAHYIHPTRGDFFPQLAKLIAGHDEPVCTVTWYSHYQVMQEIQKHKYKVVLAGHAADELVGGYYDHYLYYFWDLYKEGKHELLQHEIAAWQKNHGRDIGQWERFRETQDNTSVLSPNKAKYLNLLQDSVRANFKETTHNNAFTSLFTSRLFNELTLESVPLVLRPDDRNSMLCSIEGRVPFLDHRLVEYAYRVPNHLKIRDGTAKYILREAMKGILNEKVRTRKEKVGFNAPLNDWLRNELRAPVDTLLRDPHCKMYQYLKQDVLLTYWEEHLAEKENHMILMWHVINLELWLRHLTSNNIKPEEKRRL